MAYATQSDYSKSMRDRLSIADPEMSTELGTFARKIIDAAASQLSLASVDTEVGKHSFDPNSYSGTDLDAFMQLFGFSRQAATYAMGAVLLSRYDAGTIVSVSPGDQFYRQSTDSSPAIMFQSLAYVTMDSGETSVDVPVIAVIGGQTGNVPAGSVTSSATMLDTMMVTNELPMMGGRDNESDIELRERYTKTHFRNVAGTKDQYMALALANAFVRRANLVGQTSLSSELLTITAGSAQSTTDECAYVIDNKFGVWLRNTEKMNSDLDPYYIENVDFNLDTSVNPPRILVLAGRIPDTTVVLLEFQYLSKLSRGEGRNVELFIDGVDYAEATEERYFSALDVFVAGSGTLGVANWLHDDGLTSPTEGNFFEALAVQPATGLPDTIEFPNGTILSLDRDYWFVHDVTFAGGSPKARSGIEWNLTSMIDLSNPENLIDHTDEPYTLSYPYNRVVSTVQALVNRNTQVTANCLVHSAKVRYFELNFDVMYSIFPKANVDYQIDAILSNYFSKVGFGSFIQTSDLEAMCHEATGVDSIKFTFAREYGADGVTQLGESIYTDIKLAGNEIPAVLRVNATSRTQEVWGV